MVSRELPAATSATVRGSVILLPLRPPRVHGVGQADEYDRSLVARAVRHLYKHALMDIHGVRVFGAKFPNMPDHMTAGWFGILDTSVLPEGPIEFVVQAHAKDGGTRDLATIPVVIAR